MRFIQRLNHAILSSNVNNIFLKKVGDKMLCLKTVTVFNEQLLVDYMYTIYLYENTHTYAYTHRHKHTFLTFSHSPLHYFLYI